MPDETRTNRIENLLEFVLSSLELAVIIFNRSIHLLLITYEYLKCSNEFYNLMDSLNGTVLQLNKIIDHFASQIDHLNKLKKRVR